MFVLVALAPLLGILSVLAAACDRWGPPDPVYPEAGSGDFPCPDAWAA